MKEEKQGGTDHLSREGRPISKYVLEMTKEQGSSRLHICPFHHEGRTTEKNRCFEYCCEAEGNQDNVLVK